MSRRETVSINKPSSMSGSRDTRRVVLAVGLFLVLTVSAHAEVIAGNWCNLISVTDPPAGLLESTHWSNLTSPSPAEGGNGFQAVDTATGLGGTAAADGQDVLIYADGSPAPAGLSLSWEADNLDTNDKANTPVIGNLGEDIQDGHDQMYAGFLGGVDSDGVEGSANPSYEARIDLELTGMALLLSPGQEYDVYFYIDGDEAADAPSDWSFSDATTSYYGRDDSTFADDHTVAGSLSDYVLVNSIVPGQHLSGNAVVFSGYTADSVSWSIETTNGSDMGVTGFEIHVTPEPSSAVLLVAVLVMISARRRGSAS